MLDSRLARVAGIALWLLAAVACSEPDKSSHEMEPLPITATPTIRLFEAAPGLLTAGEATTLHWRTENVLSITIKDETGADVPLSGADVAEGSVEVTPAATTSYTITGTGPAENPGPVWRTASVTVTPVEADAPVIAEFSATPDLVAIGGEVTLSWQTTDATVLTLKDDAGVAIDLGNASLDQGQVTVRPTRATTTYALTATGPGGRDSATASVEVSGLPRVANFYVDPIAPVAPGETVKLVWETVHATRVVIHQGAATIVDTTTELSGDRDIALEDNATFTIEATGNGGSAEAEVVAQVGARIVAFTASERVVRIGDPVNLHWELEDADRANLDGPGGFHLALTGAGLVSGDATVNLGERGDFVLQAFRGSVARTAAIAVDITLAPRIRSLAVDQAVVTASAGHPATVTLSWVQDGATSCTLYANNVSVAGYEDFACGATGSAAVQVEGTATLRLVATNADGSHSATVDVQAIPPPTIVAFANSPNRRVAPGSSVELSWTVTDAVSVSMEKNDAPFSIGATAFTGTITDRVDFDSIYVLTAVNSLGFATVATVEVHAGAPVILSATAQPNFAAIGSQITLLWTADGGETLTVTDQGGVELFRTTDPAVIDHGSLPVLVPVTAGVYHYTVTDTNGAGTVTAVIEVTVSDGPMITALTANKTSLSLGENLTISWTVQNDPAGNTPTLTLTDNYGNNIDVSGKNPNLGSVTFVPAEEGPHTYTLTASTGGGRTPATKSTSVVEVTVPPHVLTFTATPDRVGTSGGTVVPDVVLSWTSENGVSVSLWECDAAGNVIPPSFFRLATADGATQAQIDAGTYHVHPTASTWYLVRVRNRVGSAAEKRVKVIVDPPEILTLTATPTEIVEGQTSQLAWTTSNANFVNFDPPAGPLSVTPAQFPYVDVSTTGTLSTISGDGSVGTIDFPVGFTFPFDGVERTAIQVSTNGWAGFNLTNTAYDHYPYAFPDESRRYINFAPYWCDLDNTKNSPAGELWSGLGRDALGDYFVIQFKNWSWWSSSYIPSNLNFEIILRRSGLFEYRYGSMTAPTAARASGEGCGIGYQYPGAGSLAANIFTYNVATPTPLANTGYALGAPQPANGSLTVTPNKTTTYSLTAMNADATAFRQVTVKVWKQPVIASVSTTPTAPTATQPFQIKWTVSDATRVRVLDDTGTAVCDETDPARALSGSCTYTAPTGGYKAFTVEASNGPLNAPLVTTTKPFNFTVFNLLSLDTFTVSPGNFVAAGTPVTLTWSARGATEAQLFSCTPGTNRTVCTDITPAYTDANHGTYTATMTKSAEFWLRIFDVVYRARDGFQAVWVDAPTLNTLSASTTQIAAGASTTLAWTSTGAKGAWMSGQPAQAPVVVTSTSPFIDLTTTGTVATLAYGTDDAGYFNIPFPDGFVFPWFGEAKTSLRVSTDGWITFNMNYTTTHNYEYTMPTSSSYAAVQIAPFWDDLKRGNGTLLWKQDQLADGTKYLVVEWKNWNFYSSTYNPSDLNFEAVLFETGDIDFRYGTMTAPTAYASAAAGDYAGMGWQSPDLTTGKMLTAAAGDVVSGGLANRSWRFPMSLAANGSTVVTPTDSTTYRMCVTNASLYLDCKEVRVVVVKGGDLLFSELMIAPATDDAEWFELRNTAFDPINVAGWQVFSGTTEQFTVPATPPVIVPAGGFAVFARSATASGGLTPNVVYGNALTLTDAGDDLRLYMAGAIIDSVTWSGTGWTIQPGKSIALEPSVMARSSTANDAGASWCPTNATYGNGTFGGSPGALGNGCLTGGANDLYVLDPVSGKPFIDISTTGVSDSGFLDSTYYTPAIALGFSMPYFGDTVTQFQFSKHGYIAFPTQTTYYSTNAAIPSTSAPNGFIAAFWDYLYSTSGQSGLHHKQVTVDGHQVMIVQWTKMSPGSTSYGTLDFQVQLWDTGDIGMVYRNLYRSPSYTYDYTYGSSATFGIENIAGTQAIQLFNGSSSSGGGPIYSGRSYLFRRK